MQQRSAQDDIDLDYRPVSYFRPHKLEQYLLSTVKGAVMRKKLQSLFDAGNHAQAGALLASAGLTDQELKRLESVHPMFMGGQYLPDTEAGEVEIARIRLRSTTFDVTSVYARKEEGVIYYRVVDEYGGGTLQGSAEAQTVLPMTLREFTEFLLQAWPLIDLLDSSFEDDLAGALNFFSADSAFYPELDSLCRQLVRERLADDEPDAVCDEGDNCPVCGYCNSPPADDTCEHLCAFVWDGRVEPLGSAIAVEEALQELASVTESAKEDVASQWLLEREARRSTTRAALINAVSGELDLVSTLQALACAEPGSGWSTTGMLGGSGYNVYVPDPALPEALITECEAIIAACGIEIATSNSEDTTLEARRPSEPVDWQQVASGFWSEGVYHSGHIAYRLAKTGVGAWILEGLERNVELDGLTEEDVEAGRVNDDQLQAMWGMTLEEAQSVEYRKIVAACSGAAPDADAGDIAAILYRAVCLAGGKEITEPDAGHSLPGDDLAALVPATARGQ